MMGKIVYIFAPGVTPRGFLCALCYLLVAYNVVILLGVVADLRRLLLPNHTLSCVRY